MGAMDGVNTVLEAGSIFGGPAAPVFKGLAIASKLGGALLRIRSQKARMRQRQDARRKALEPMVQEMEALQAGPSASEGALQEGAVNQALSGLSERGILNSSFAAPEIAASIAPYALAREQRRSGLRARLAAARMSIADDEGGPGYTDALAGAAVDAAGLFAMEAGKRDARNGRRNPEIESGNDTAGNQDPYATDLWASMDTGDLADPSTSLLNAANARGAQRRRVLGY